MARYFDGVDDYIRRNGVNVSLSSQLTICMWVKTTATTLGRLIDWNRDPGNFYYEWVFQMNADGTIRFWDYHTSDYGFRDDTTNQSTVSINDGQWHHIAFVKNGTSGAYYIDCQLRGTPTASANISYGTRGFTIGIDYRDMINLGNGRPFGGYISEVRIYNRALSQSEIQSEMYRRIPAKQNLVIYLPLWEREGSIVLDNTGNGNDGTIYGATYADDPPMLGGSIVTP